MKNIYFISFLLIVLLIYSGCSLENQNQSVSQNRQDIEAAFPEANLREAITGRK